MKPLQFMLPLVASILVLADGEATDEAGRQTKFSPTFEELAKSQLSAGQFAKLKFYGCHGLKYENELCPACCRQTNQLAQPDLLASHCDCVAPQDAPFLAANKGIKKKQEEGAKAHESACEQFRFGQAECKSCCNGNWLAPYKGLIANRCRCGQVLREWDYDAGEHIYVLKKSGIFGGESKQRLGFVSEYDQGRLKDGDDGSEPSADQLFHY